MGSRLRESVRFLFELFCEVSPGDNNTEPFIVRKFPESHKNDEELKNVPKFTFPCQLERSYMQNYSFVLTSMESKYTFCFCRYDPKTNTALVLLSHLPWHNIFYKLLNCIASLMNSPQKEELNSFLEACRIRPPMPGHTLKVTFSAGNIDFSCQCPTSKLPSIPENCNLTEFFSAVDTDCMAGLWAALLHERRVAIISSKPARVSACVQAANATLFPMSWQHIYIPILPRHLIDYLLAPMPFLIGVPRAVMENVRMSDIGDVVILDADANKLVSPFRDLESLPSGLVHDLKKALSDKHALGDAVSRAFLRALVCLIGGYRDAIRIEPGEVILTFNREDFIKTRKNMQPFLEKILESQIFRQFIDERLDLLNSGQGFNDEFEMECHLQADKFNTGSGHHLKQQYKDWAKNVKKEGGEFFKNFKDRANPAVQTAVNRVKQGGKNMKSAVRGLKNRMPKSGHRPSSRNTTDDSKYSCGSATPISSDSESSPQEEAPREAPPPLPLDLLTEMEFLLNSAQRRDSLPACSQNMDLSPLEKAKTLSPNAPPLIPDRPKAPVRYPIIPTRNLVDLSDAPAPPPRSCHTLGQNSSIITNIIKDANGTQNFHTSTLSFAEYGKDKNKLKLTMSSNQRRPAIPQNGVSNPQSAVPPMRVNKHPRAVASQPKHFTVEASSSDSDLIKLDDSPTNIEEFDPLRGKGDTARVKSSTDSALLHEYGLDFSQYQLLGTTSDCTRPEKTSQVPKGWTTFN